MEQKNAVFMRLVAFRKRLFDNIKIGGKYSSTQLAELWGYKSHHALVKGVVTPANSNIIILFVTKEKQTGATPYIDEIQGNILFMMGQEKHGTDRRLEQNLYENKDDIHLFYRDKHHEPFIYYGIVHIIGANIKEDEPSEFEIWIGNVAAEIDSEDVLIDYIVNEPYNQSSELFSEGKSRISYHLSYERNPRNRKEAIRIQGTSCKICGFNFGIIYGNDLANNYIEIHHIKQLADGIQAPDPAKDLIPVCANCHRMLHRKKSGNIQIGELKELKSLIRYRNMLSDISKKQNE